MTLLLTLACSLKATPKGQPDYAVGDLVGTWQDEANATYDIELVGGELTLTRAHSDYFPLHVVDSGWKGDTYTWKVSTDDDVVVTQSIEWVAGDRAGSEWKNSNRQSGSEVLVRVTGQGSGPRVDMPPPQPEQLPGTWEDESGAVYTLELVNDEVQLTSAMGPGFALTVQSSGWADTGAYSWVVRTDDGTVVEQWIDWVDGDQAGARWSNGDTMGEEILVRR